MDHNSSPTLPAALEDDSQRKSEMLDINQRQRSFYENKVEKRNAVTQTWAGARAALRQVSKESRLSDSIYGLHRQWLGDLSGKRVLDLGCFSGNVLSLEIAAASGSYLGIDLSRPAIDRLQQKLDERGLSHAQARPLDFLADDFPNEPFDVIYAHSVMHHFKYFESFLATLRRRVAPGGSVITYDPLETSWPIWIARRLYRPFQSDAEWEYPFTRRSFGLIQRYFHIEALQGILGYSKWGAVLAKIPGLSSRMVPIIQRLHQRDLKLATKPGRALWRCMHVAMRLRRRD